MGNIIRRRFSVNRIGAIVGALALVAGVLCGCGTANGGATTGSSDAAAGTAPCPSKLTGDPVIFADNQFQTLYINNAVAEYIVENGFCQPTKTDTVSTDVTQQELAAGAIDVWMEMWQQNYIDWYNTAIKAGQIVNLGHIYDTSTQGWYVPKYVVDGDASRGIKASAPGLTDVSQLSKYWQVFKDPHNPKKGLFVNCIAQWNCAGVNEVLLQAYGLTKYYDIETPGAAPALDAAIVGAYQKGQPILAYYWAPTWLLGQYDMVELKQPPYNATCDSAIQSLIKDNEIAKATAADGCGYQSLPIDKGASAAWAKKDPDVAAFLKKMDIGNDPLEKAAAYMQSKNATAAQAADYFFTNNESEWQGWLPANVATRVTNALKADGVKLS